MPLTTKEAKFIAAYQATGNQVESAKIAGYSPKNLAPQASRLLKNAKVKAEIDKFKAQKREELSKETFVDKAMNCFDELDVQEPNKPRFLDIAGKALGYIGANPDSRPNQSLTIVNINADGKSQAEIWELTRKLLDAQ